jgi:hypothetical protein
MAGLLIAKVWYRRDLHQYEELVFSDLYHQCDNESSKNALSFAL